MELFYLGVFTCALAGSLVLTVIVRAIARRIGFLDAPAERKVHRHPVALGGGIAIAGSFVLAVSLAMLLSRSDPQEHSRWFGPPFSAVLSRLGENTRDVWTLLAAASALAVVGLVDDIFEIRARYKFAGQLVVAVFLVLFGHSASLFLANRIVAGLLTVVWIVGITNAFNLLDNMDGLAAGVAFLTGTIFFVVSIQTGQIVVSVVLLALMGAALGFLIFNFSPASIFMGDCGSLFLGCVLGVCAVDFTYISHGLQQTQAFLPIAAPLLLFAVPIYDTASVIIIRLREGRHPFHPDKKHFSHRLVDLGMSQGTAVLTIYLLALALGLSATLLRFLDAAGMIVAVIQAIAIVAVIVLLEKTGMRR
ncbi:MAG: MraY family glycosyltransferase [Planctomycetota bacterium]